MRPTIPTFMTSISTYALLAFVAVALPAISGCGRSAQGETNEQKTAIYPVLHYRSTGASDREFLAVQRRYEALKDDISTSKHPSKPMAEMAALLMSEARVTGRHHDYIPGARVLLDSALVRDPASLEALLYRATLAMTLHQFKQAHDLAQRAIVTAPRTALGWGVLCDALVELGDYEEAVRAADTMLAIRPDLRSYARASYLRELYGRDAEATQAMLMAVDAGMIGTEERSWALYQLGNLYVMRGALDTAEYLFTKLLEERPSYPYALEGLASVRRSQGNPTEAIELLMKAAGLSGDHLLSERIAETMMLTGDTSGARKIAGDVLSAFAEHERDGWNIDREYARFCLEMGMNIPEALRRAEADYRRRPNNIDALETYAHALYVVGRSAEALPLIKSALRLGTNNPVLHVQQGMIAIAAGDTAEGHSALRRAIAINPKLPNPYGAIARRTLGLSQKVAIR